jgi:hypothetical protein
MQLVLFIALKSDSNIIIRVYNRFARALLEVAKTLKGILTSSFKRVNYICKESFKLLSSNRFIKGPILIVSLLQVMRVFAQYNSYSIYFTRVSIISLRLSLK